MSEDLSKIMVCIDGSEASIKAARKVLDMAKKYKAEIYAIYVSFNPDSISRATQYIGDELN